MDSLLANYASSDEEQDQQPHKPTPSPKTTTTTTSSSSFFSTLPPPKSSSSSLFQSLPPPKQPSSTEIPKPKSQFPEQQPKRVVQFRPPIIPLPNPTDLEDDDDHEVDEEEEERNRRRKLESSTQAPSVKSFLSTIPAPRNTATLGVQSSSGSGRRSIIETDAPAPAPAPVPAPVPELPASSSAGEESVDQNAAGYENYQYGTEQYDSYGNYSWGTEPEAGAVYGNNGGDDAYANYAAYGDQGQGQYESNWIDRSVPPEASGVSDTTVIFPSKRRRNEIPTEVIEVKQDELMKNRPREDQAKITGIAFGPSYMVLFTCVFYYLAFDFLNYRFTYILVHNSK